MRLQFIGLSFIIGSAIILYFDVPQDLLHFVNFAYSETSEILNLSNEIINSTFPQINTHNNDIFVVWSGNVGHGVNEIQSDIFFTKSENKGSSFGEPINLSNNPGSSFNPHSEIYSNNIYVVWEDDTLADAETHDLSANTSILFTKSKDNGTTFLPAVPLSYITADSSNPDITTINGNTVFVVWQDNFDESSKIVFKKSMSSNNAFSDQQNISNIQENNFEISPQIITSNNTINIIWDDFSPKEESSHILKRSSIDDGITFGRIMQLSNYSEFAINDISNAYNSNIYIVWQGNFKGQFDIFLSKSYDGGITFSKPINLSNSTNADSINPQLASTANELFVVWQEDLSGNNQIYFTKVDTL